MKQIILVFALSVISLFNVAAATFDVGGIDNEDTTISNPPSAPLAESNPRPHHQDKRCSFHPYFENECKIFLPFMTNAPIDNQPANDDDVPDDPQDDQIDPGDPSSTKKGVGAVVTSECADVETLRGAWYHNWHAWADRDCDPSKNQTFVPRIYNAERMIYLDIAIQNAKSSGWIIGFNEPNLPWQGNLSPVDGAIAWRQLEIATEAEGIKLVSPVPNQWVPGFFDPHGNQWTWAMVAEYEKLYGTRPRFDALGWNIYKATGNDIQTYLMDRRTEALALGYDVPFWVLEYGGVCTASVDNNMMVMSEITPWFEETDWIDRYSWFANRLDGSTNQAEGWQFCTLIDPATGELSELGKIYSGY